MASSRHSKMLKAIWFVINCKKSPPEEYSLKYLEKIINHLLYWTTKIIADNFFIVESTLPMQPSPVSSGWSIDAEALQKALWSDYGC